MYKEIDKLKSTCTSEETLKKKNEDYEIVKQMVVDRDKTIKKMEDNHKKEFNDLKTQKKASDDALNKSTQELKTKREH